MQAREQGQIRHFELRGGDPCLDFANTVAWRLTEHPVDYLESLADLLAWGSQVGVLAAGDLPGHGREDARSASGPGDVVARARALRETIYRVVTAALEATAPDTTDLAALNRAVSDARAHQRLVHAGDIRFEWCWDDGSAAERVLWSVATSAVDLLTTSRITRVKVCAGTGCGWLFVDASRNHSRRWCDTRDCGNRERVRKHLAARRSDRHPR